MPNHEIKASQAKERQAVVIVSQHMELIYVPASPGRNAHTYLTGITQAQRESMTRDNWDASARFAEGIIGMWREKYPSGYLPGVILLAPDGRLS
jgi:hypothetical protein